MAALREAMLWEPQEDQRVRCKLCGHRCVIRAGQYGRCRVRENVDGRLRTHTFGRLVALNVDPIEKKPLFHFLPGTQALSIAAAGCNFTCDFCQNWRISQPSDEDREAMGEAVSPDQVVALAGRHGCASISYTYTEPTIFFEMAYECAQKAHAEGILNCFVSNGYLTPEAVETIAPHLDAINVDLKAFRDETYREVIGARLEPVLECLRALKAAGIWTEVTTLVVPGMNDSEAELTDIAQFIAGELGPHVPWHVSRFHGDYHRTSTPTTPIETLRRATELGKQAGLKYVYCGNVPGEADESTHCPACGRTVIERTGFRVGRIDLRDGACVHCGEPVEGVWTAAATSQE